MWNIRGLVPGVYHGPHERTMCLIQHPLNIMQIARPVAATELARASEDHLLQCLDSTTPKHGEAEETWPRQLPDQVEIY